MTHLQSALRAGFAMACATFVACGDTSPVPDNREPVQYRLRQIMLEPEISAERDAEIRKRAEVCLERARSGEDIGLLAKTLSEEPNAATGAGDLGFFRHGDMIKPFSDVVFSMTPGEITGPVKTQFGYHVIKLHAIRGNERHAQHILFMLKPGREDSLATLTRLEKIAAALRKGADFGELLRQNTTDQLLLVTEGCMVWQTPDMLLDSFREAVRGLHTGDVTDPFVSILGMHVVVVDSINYDPGITLDGFPPAIEARLKNKID